MRLTHFDSNYGRMLRGIEHKTKTIVLFANRCMPKTIKNVTEIVKLRKLLNFIFFYFGFFSSPFCFLAFFSCFISFLLLWKIDVLHMPSGISIFILNDICSSCGMTGLWTYQTYRRIELWELNGWLWVVAHLNSAENFRPLTNLQFIVIEMILANGWDQLFFDFFRSTLISAPALPFSFIVGSSLDYSIDFLSRPVKPLAIYGKFPISFDCQRWMSSTKLI